MNKPAHSTNSKRIWIAVTTLASLSASALLSAPTWAQPDVNNAAKAENPANRGRGKGKGLKANREANLKLRQDTELEALATATGKTFTDEEKLKIRDAMAIRENAIQAARLKYLSDLAATTGIEADELGLKLRQAMVKRAGREVGGQGAKRNNRANRRNRNGANANAAPAAPAVAQ